MSVKSSGPRRPKRPKRKPSTPWRGRVVYSPRDGGYARRPGEILSRDAVSRDRINRIVGLQEVRTIDTGDGEREYLHRFEERTKLTVEDVIDKLHFEQLSGEPNYVMFANPIYANPVYANPVYANPVYANPADEQASGQFANPVYANPVYASPVYANPVYANPIYANAYICDGTRPSTARPAQRPDRKGPPHYGKIAGRGRAVIFDTGISKPKFCPPMLRTLSDRNRDEWEVPDNGKVGKGDGFLDPVSGHGTFIAGIIQTLAPGTKILPRNIITSFGDVDVFTVVSWVARLLAQGKFDKHTVVNMSFGGYADRNMDSLQRAVRRIQRQKAVVVASAGNDATSRPMFPACLPGVVGVAALGRHGRAPFSNHGPWVSACAPGTDLVSAFYRYNGDMELFPMPGSADPDEYENWARWTGTSFAAPIVVSALLQHMRLTGCTARKAADRVVYAPGLFRLPDMGTVVNLDLGDRFCF